MKTIIFKVFKINKICDNFEQKNLEKYKKEIQIMVNINDNNIWDFFRHELNESNINYNELSEESDNDINYDLNEDSVNHKNVMKTKLSNDVLLEKINNNEVIEEIDENNQLIK